MKNKNLTAAVAAAMLVGAGCASTPRVVRVVPVYAGATNAATQPSPYRFSQEPAKRLLEDEGKEYRAHARELQRMRLAHERALVGIEQAAEEARLAKERGVNLQTPPQPQAAARMPQRQNGGATFGVLPNGAPVLLPSQPMVPVAPANGGYYQYSQPWAPHVITPGGVPVLLPSGGGGGYGGGWGGGWGYNTPISSGTYRSAARADWGPVRGGLLGKVERWLSQSQTGPGYRHTGGPATITRTYGASADVVAEGGFTSGLAVRGGWWGR